jgi:hypothetical protein
MDLDLLFHVFGEIGNVYVATGAAIFTVDGGSEGLDGYLIAVATKTGGWVNGHSLLGMSGENPGKGQEHHGNKFG